MLRQFRPLIRGLSLRITSCPFRETESLLSSMTRLCTDRCITETLSFKESVTAMHRSGQVASDSGVSATEIRGPEPPISVADTPSHPSAASEHIASTPKSSAIPTLRTLPSQASDTNRGAKSIRKKKRLSRASTITKNQGAKANSKKGLLSETSPSTMTAAAVAVHCSKRVCGGSCETRGTVGTKRH